MVSAQTILNKLPSYRAIAYDVKDKQQVGDIVLGMDWMHGVTAADYDSIAKYFIGSTPERTLRNLFDFIKQNSDYVIEGDELQTVKTPAAIVSEGYTYGNDCKNYSLFIGGVIDAINRTGKQHIPFAYRFASYEEGEPVPGHVFVVAYPGTDYEIWVDPVLNYFNERLIPEYAYDKKNSTMLSVVSGIPSYGNHGVGAVDPATAAAVAQALPKIADMFKSLFGGGKSQHWKGWTDNACRYWIHIDGDDVKNEVENILAYINNKGLTNLGWLTAQMDQSPPVTPQLLRDKFSRGGYAQAGSEIANLLQQYINTGSVVLPNVPGGNTQNPNNPPLEGPGINWQLIGWSAAAIGIFYVVSKSNK